MHDSIRWGHVFGVFCPSVGPKGHALVRFLVIKKKNCVVDLLFYTCVDADMEDYGFEYSEEEQEEQDVDIENQYYNAKGTSN